MTRVVFLSIVHTTAERLITSHPVSYREGQRREYRLELRSRRLLHSSILINA
jgi:hypothetical protein